MDLGSVSAAADAARGRPPAIPGLSHEEVAARTAAGAVNTAPAASTRSVLQILRANVLTRFNAILGALFAVVLVVGPLQDGLFGVVLAVNTVIGVVQELRAKWTLDRLTLLTAPHARAVRDGATRDVPVDQVVVDDVLELRLGDQVAADGTVLVTEGLEVDESLLSGESMPVPKAPGDGVLSGSAVVAGHGVMRVDRVGADAFAQRLEREARRFDLVRSELRNGINRILRVVSWVMVPLGLLLVTSQVIRSGQAFDNAVRGSVAGVGAMVPEGLVLLTTVAFAVGALRLAKRRVLVQELAAIEGLARVDTLCIDKTGTLTEPGLHLQEIVSVGGAPTREAVAAMAAEDRAPNATMLATRAVTAPPGWAVLGTVAFSSQRKWSAMEFADQGTWVIGAPEVVMPTLAPRYLQAVRARAAGGERVLLVARSPAHLAPDGLPRELECAGWVVYEERLRPDAAGTIGYLQAQGIRVVVLSGDAPETVATVARAVGIPGADRPLHAASLPTDPAALAEALRERSVIGRVQPSQKRDVVRALQQRAHVVAMTGDGVNDIPALKAADLGIAMGTGSPAARAVGRVVLLDSSFAVVPEILGEGRRVIANIQRVARLFLTKTVYATALALVVGIAAVPYPFYPRHLTLVSSLTIGIPGFFLALAPGAPRAQPDFVRRVLSLAVPAGVIAASATLAAYLVARVLGGATGLAARTAATGVLVTVGLAVLVLVSRPLTGWRLLVTAAMAGVAVGAWLVPLGRHIFGLQAPPPVAAVASALIAAAAVFVLAVAAGLTGPARSLWRTVVGGRHHRRGGAAGGSGDP